jgi:hypothetical protein
MCRRFDGIESQCAWMDASMATGSAAVRYAVEKARAGRGEG